jgi:hypothetical protein
MSDVLTQIPEIIQNHIRDITRSSGLPNNEESVAQIAMAWIEKKNSFEEKIESMNMEEVDTLEKDSDKGAIVLTYSGSLLNVGPNTEDGRNVEYTSVGLRKDVPDIITNENCKLKSDLIIDEVAEFENARPVKSTSQIFKIAICKDADITQEEEEELLKKTATVIMDDFVEVNKTIMIDEDLD